MKHVILLVCCATFLTGLPFPVFASEQFKTTFVTNYVIKEDASTVVNQNITLTNKDSTAYVTEYAIEIGSSAITAIKPTLIDGSSIAFTTTSTDTSTVIKLRFDIPVVGKDKQLQFNISYINPDVTSAIGKIVEISIPKITNISDIENYTTNLVVPKTFGPAHFISPSTYEIEETSMGTILTFDKEATKQSITALFGDSQIMAFTLSYHLENPTVNKALTQIALPPDTAYQKMYYDSLEPKPDSVARDVDGNWLATYRLKPKETINVVAGGAVELFLKPSVLELPISNVDTYVKPQVYWEVEHPQIKKLASELTTPQAIYDYVVSTLTYDYSKIQSQHQRLGAVGALETPSNALCQEFTDTFIAIARAGGIPAREINGYAFAKNSKLRPLSLVQDVLHSWPEYYNESTKTWIPVDPTWGNTTGGIDYFNRLDLNHFAFVIHGSHSETPYAAGYYKLDNTASKDVLINFISEKPQINLSFEPSLTLSPFHIIGVPGDAKLKIVNNSNVAVYNLPFNITSSYYHHKTSSQDNIEEILPFSSTTAKITLQPTSLALLQPVPFRLSINHNTYEYLYTINQDTSLKTVLGLCLGGASLVIAAGTWRLLVFIQGWYRALRR